MTTSIIETVAQMAELADWCYAQQMSHLVCDGKDYYPCTNMWSGRPVNLSQRDWDPDRECIGYNRCCRKGEIEDTSVSDSDEEVNAHHDDMIMPDDPNDVHYVFENHETLTHKGATSITFTGHVSLRNPHGSNDDHRGCDHLNLWLVNDRRDEFSFAAGIYPVAKVLEGFWRIKHNKFDNHYEWFIPFGETNADGTYELEDLSDPSSCRQRIMHLNGSWYVKPDVDHGS